MGDYGQRGIDRIRNIGAVVGDDLNILGNLIAPARGFAQDGDGGKVGAKHSVHIRILVEYHGCCPGKIGEIEMVPGKFHSIHLDAVNRKVIVQSGVAVVGRRRNLHGGADLDDMAAAFLQKDLSCHHAAFLVVGAYNGDIVANIAIQGQDGVSEI